MTVAESASHPFGKAPTVNGFQNHAETLADLFGKHTKATITD